MHKAGNLFNKSYIFIIYIENFKFTKCMWIQINNGKCIDNHVIWALNYIYVVIWNNLE